MKFTQRHLDAVKEKLLTEDRDWLDVIDGPEGIGKTSLGWSKCHYIDPTWDPAFGIVFDLKELKYFIRNSHPGQAVLIDEGAFFFYSRDSMSRTTKEAIKILTAVRQRNLFICICVPNFQILDKYIREHRVKTLSRVVSRGWYWIYSKPNIGRIKFDKNDMKKTVWPTPNFRDNFPDAKMVWPAEWTKYVERKLAQSVDPSKSERGVEGKPFHCDKCGRDWTYGGRLVSPRCMSCHSSRTHPAV